MTRTDAGSETPFGAGFLRELEAPRFGCGAGCPDKILRGDPASVGVYVDGVYVGTLDPTVY